MPDRVDSMLRTLGSLALAPALALALAVPLAGQVSATTTSARAGVTWHQTKVGSDQELRGLDAIDGRTAWVSGDAGGVWLTTDRGHHWKDVAPPHSSKLLFRDVEATDARHALILAVGTKTASRIYRTTNGGRTWTKTFVNHNKQAFYDCMAMWPGGRVGLAMSDPVNGKFRVIRTTNGGRSWAVVPRRGMPKAVDGEFGFAASGTCLVTAGHQRAWIASGGAASRVFRTTNRGRTWHVADSTIPASAAGGTFGLSFRTPSKGLAVGGDFTLPKDGTDASASTRKAGARGSTGATSAATGRGSTGCAGRRACGSPWAPAGATSPRTAGAAGRRSARGTTRCSACTAGCAGPPDPTDEWGGWSDSSGTSGRGGGS